MPLQVGGQMRIEINCAHLGYGDGRISLYGGSGTSSLWRSNKAMDGTSLAYGSIGCGGDRNRL